MSNSYSNHHLRVVDGTNRWRQIFRTERYNDVGEIKGGVPSGNERRRLRLGYTETRVRDHFVKFRETCDQNRSSDHQSIVDKSLQGIDASIQGMRHPPTYSSFFLGMLCIHSCIETIPSAQLLAHDFQHLILCLLCSIIIHVQN